MQNHPLLTLNDVQMRLQISRSQVYKLISQGELAKPIKIGSSSRWRTEDINAFILRLAGEQSVY